MRIEAVAAKMLQKTQDTRDYLAWTAGNGDPMHRFVHTRQDTSRMRTARVKQEETADAKIIS